MPTRREFLRAGGILAAGLLIANRTSASVIQSGGGSIVEIGMKSDLMGSHVWFDPIGLLIKPGQTVRWICVENVHTVTAYHPSNGNRSLRIPEKAAPWDSGFLQPGGKFEYTFTEEGVYDYFCLPHEGAGMVGRIIAGRPSGPGALPYDYYRGRPGTADWLPMPPAAQKAFPSVEQIMNEKEIRFELKE